MTALSRTTLGKTVNVTSGKTSGDPTGGTVTDGVVNDGVVVERGVADQAVVDLLGMIAYGELTAFERLATDARMASTLSDKISLAAMAAAEFTHFEAISMALAGRGVDPEAAMAPFIGPLHAFHTLTAPADWLESLVKAYVGD